MRFDIQLLRGLAILLVVAGIAFFQIVRAFTPVYAVLAFFAFLPHRLLPRRATLPVVWFAAGEKHWHGATPTTAMTHIAIQEKKDGKVVEWMEKVSDEQYRSGE